MHSSTTIEFDLSDKDQSKSFAMLISNFQACGVDFSLQFEMNIQHVAVKIKNYA